MKKDLLLFPILFIALGIIILIGLEAQESAYVGVNKCKTCHKSAKSGNQYGKWKESAHTKGFQSLTTDAALKIAEKAGLTASPSESDECLVCHSPYALSAPKFKEDGVGCEACHGPGRKYKGMSIMKDRDLAKEKGLVLLDTDEAKETFCAKCHKVDNPYHEVKEFCLQEFWLKIVHLIPKRGNKKS